MSESILNSAYVKSLRARHKDDVDQCATNLIIDAQRGGRESMAWEVFAQTGDEEITGETARKAARLVLGVKGPE